jgi:hypothetical protein
MDVFWDMLFSLGYGCCMKEKAPCSKGLRLLTKSKAHWEFT